MMLEGRPLFVPADGHTGRILGEKDLLHVRQGEIGDSFHVELNFEQKRGNGIGLQNLFDR